MSGPLAYGLRSTKATLSLPGWFTLSSFFWGGRDVGAWCLLARHLSQAGLSPKPLVARLLTSTLAADLHSCQNVFSALLCNESDAAQPYDDGPESLPIMTAIAVPHPYPDRAVLNQADASVRVRVGWLVDR